ncbi:helix-turn-helix domain-containing protein [Salinibacterium sp. G-O1]|uniref:TetR/AcrR family transcriptional regulator n=1 Tax=Salinibacterium sp. G-O1 TaxID=3046208 RepID=UPI0024B961D5|nr:TetR/AcrR family transcriptional regulator [Salinibacterium sp. G-O1]MDJ0333735.1 helix-turn-helix domain-containing protein [Salinibacterium sp. G-O1]
MASALAGRIRSDSIRNRVAIVDAALHALSETPFASMADIAGAAGVSRGTLYGHFPSRRALVLAASGCAAIALKEVFTHLDPALAPQDALGALVATSWRELGYFTGILVAAQVDLRAEELERLRNVPMSGIVSILERGRDAGAFRSDQDVGWQVACILAVMHVGAMRIAAGRPESNVADEMTSTVWAVLAAEFEGSA